MKRKRIIPCILILNQRAVITKQFQNPYYVSDPYNLIRIFYEKQVDELMIVDINEYFGFKSDISYLASLASYCKTPLSIGGGIRSVDDIAKLINSGAERVILGNHTIQNLNLLEKAINSFGSSSITVNIDYKRGLNDKERYCLGLPEFEVFVMAEKVSNLGAGEIMFTSSDCNGMSTGYDFEYINNIAVKLHVPVVINGGGISFNYAELVMNKTSISAAVLSTNLTTRQPHRSVLPVYGNEK